MSINRDTIVERVVAAARQYGIELDDIVVEAGGAMVMLGLRETTADIDCSTSVFTWELLTDRYPDLPVVDFPAVGDHPAGRYIQLPGEIAVHVSECLGPFHTYKGVAYSHLEDVLKLKQALGRDKDKDDIAILEARLAFAKTLKHDESRWPHMGRGGLPGNRVFINSGNAVCDDHLDRPAVIRIQGETDSFGCEYLYMCQECLDEYDRVEGEQEDECERCGSTDDVGPYRDPDEGMSGPVYHICSTCRAKSNAYHSSDIDWYDDDEEY